MRNRHRAATAMLAAACFLSQATTRASELQWTAVTLARDGAVGQGMHDSRAKAVALAIADCRQMRRWSNDCGSLLVTLQQGWAIAMVCGNYGILVAARTMAETEAGAARRQASLRAKAEEVVPACAVAAVVGGGASQ